MPPRTLTRGHRIGRLPARRAPPRRAGRSTRSICTTCAACSTKTNSSCRTPSPASSTMRSCHRSRSTSRNTFPRELIPGLAELGPLGSSLEGYGCAGMNSVSYRLICQGSSAATRNPQLRLGAVEPLHVPDPCLRQRGAAAQVPPRMAKGELIGCFGLTEPHGGSDPANMKTHAKRRGRVTGC